MNALYQVVEYLKFLWRSKNEHSVHSPFVFELYTEVIHSHRHFYFFDQLNKLRKAAEKSELELEVYDLGAPSTILNTKRKLKDIVQKTCIPSKKGELLFKLINYFQPKTILEIGTCLGFSASYLASANSKSSVITFEGQKHYLKIAQTHWDKLELKNIQVVEGNFDIKLPNFLSSAEKIDFVFLDGNHQYEPTLRYINLIKPYLNDTAVIVLDDIYWSHEMKGAWQELVKDTTFDATIDLFHVGILIKRNKQEKQHFNLRF